MFEKVQQLLADNLEVEAASINLDTRLYEDLGVDSIDLFNLIDVFESSLGVRIGENQSIKTVSELVEAAEAASAPTS
ncbi:phosphopantetheine-binding protein [Schaalia odontolytica]|jgi:Acyl carrier protein